MSVTFDAQGNAINSADAPEDVDPSAVAEDAPAPEARIPVKLASGQTGTVPESQLADALKKGATIHDPAGDAKRAEHDSLKSQFLAGSMGFARMLTFGASDEAAAKYADSVGAGKAGRQYLRDLQEEHPYITGAGEIAGTLAPALLSGGASAAAEGEGAASGLGRLLNPAGALGEAAERGAARLVPGTAESLVGKMAIGAAKMGARGAAEGALYGAGHEVSEAALGDHELTAERVVAGMGSGALFGGALGGITGAAIPLAKVVTGKLGKLAGSITAKAGEAEAAPVTAAAKAGQVTYSPGVVGRLEKLADEKAYRAIDARKAFTKVANDIPGGIEGVGRAVREAGVLKAGETVEQLAPKLEAAKNSAGSAIGDLLEKADAEGFEGPSFQRIKERLSAEVAPKFGKLQSINRSAINAVQDVVDDLAANVGENGRFTFKDLQGLRSQLDDVIKWNTNPLGPTDPKAVALKAVRGVLEDELTNAGEEAAKGMGGSFRAEYQAAKLNYRRLAVASKAADDATSAMQTNRLYSASDHGVGASAMLAGAMHGSLGAGAVLGAAGTLGNKFLRTRGNSTIAVLAERASKLAALQSASEAVDGKIVAGLKGFFRAGEKESAAPGSVSLLRGTQGLTPRAAYTRIVQSVSAAAAHPERHAEETAAITEQFHDHAPSTSQAVAITRQKALGYVASKIPKGHVDPSSITPQLEVAHVSDADRARFMRIVQAVDDPSSVLEDMRHGRATREQFDALRAVYPKLYAQISQQAVAAASSRSKTLDYTQKLQLSLLLGTPTDASLQPKFIAAMQQNFASAPQQQGPQPGGGGGGGTPKRVLKAASGAAMTTTERVSR